MGASSSQCPLSVHVSLRMIDLMGDLHGADFESIGIKNFNCFENCCLFIAEDAGRFCREHAFVLRAATSGRGRLSKTLSYGSLILIPFTGKLGSLSPSVNLFHSRAETFLCRIERP